MVRVEAPDDSLTHVLTEKQGRILDLEAQLCNLKTTTSDRIPELEDQVSSVETTNALFNRQVDRLLDEICDAAIRKWATYPKRESCSLNRARENACACAKSVVLSIRSLVVRRQVLEVTRLINWPASTHILVLRLLKGEENPTTLLGFMALCLSLEAAELEEKIAEWLETDNRPTLPCTKVLLGIQVIQLFDAAPSIPFWNDGHVKAFMKHLDAGLRLREDWDI